MAIAFRQAYNAALLADAAYIDFTTAAVGDRAV
jgi:hypothetical protein